MGDDERDDEHARGGMRFQDSSTTPREPSLAERRARELDHRRRRAAAESRKGREAQRLAERRRQAQDERRQAEEAEGRAHRKRNKVVFGASVTVGIVAFIAITYAASRPEATQTALCVDEETDEVVDDANCVTPAANDTAGGFYPIFIGAGGRQYHYNYGGTGTVGQRVSGGTTVVPGDGTRVTTPSGRDISRGGLGVSGGGSSSGS